MQYRAHLGVPLDYDITHIYSVVVATSVLQPLEMEEKRAPNHRPMVFPYLRCKSPLLGIITVETNERVQWLYTKDLMITIF